MRKLIITENQFKALKKRIAEDIHPSEAATSKAAIRTVIDGKRGLEFIPDALPDALDMLQAAGVHLLPTGTRHGYVIYRDGYEKNAHKLLSIIKKNNGYLALNTPEETYEIGKLLGYSEEGIRDFIQNAFPHNG